MFLVNSCIDISIIVGGLWGRYFQAVRDLFVAVEQRQFGNETDWPHCVLASTYKCVTVCQKHLKMGLDPNANTVSRAEAELSNKFIQVTFRLTLNLTCDPLPWHLMSVPICLEQVMFMFISVLPYLNSHSHR